MTFEDAAVRNMRRLFSFLEGLNNYQEHGFVGIIELHKYTLEGNLLLLSMGAATHDASASTGMVGSTLIYLSIVLLAPYGLQSLSQDEVQQKFSRPTLPH